MYKIPDESVAKWGKTSGMKLPHAVDTICPFCGRSVTFALTAWFYARNISASYMPSRCSGCGKSANFLWIHNSENVPNKDVCEKALYIWPTPKLIRKPIYGLETSLAFPETLKRAYSSAIRTFNVREWTAAAVLCGRVLEGLTKTLLPEDNQKAPLAHQLQDLPKYLELDKPLLKLADGIRKGRNIGAHFDFEKEPDQETTEMMLDLLDYLIEYLFILPGRVDRLHDRLASAK